MSSLNLPHKHGFWYYALETCFAVIQVVVAKIQAALIVANTPISHVFWGFSILIVGVAMVLLYKHLTHVSWWKAIKFGLILTLIRFVVFTPLLNLFRHKSMFYLGRGAIMDRLVGNWFPLLWGAALGALIMLQF